VCGRQASRSTRGVVLTLTTTPLALIVTAVRRRRHTTTRAAVGCQHGAFVHRHYTRRHRTRTHALTFKHGVDATHRCSLLKPRNKQLEGLFTAQEINSTVLHSNYVSCFTARLLCRPIAVMSSTESATNGLALLVNDCHYDEQPLWFGTRVPN